MSEPPATSIDAIMASIRAEVSGSKVAETPPPVAPRPAFPAANLSRADQSTADSITLDELMRSILAPLLKEWLDARLPEIVEAATHAEIRRLTGLSE